MLATLPARIIGYNSHRELGWPVIRPFNLTYSVTGRCNSKCMTCNIWKHKPDYEMTTEEWKKVIFDIGKCPEWVTISGGEPFLRDDLVEIAGFIVKHNKPHIMNIATNGIMTDKIVDTVRKINHNRLIVNVSMDGTEDANNRLRGVSCFAQSVETVKRLKEKGIAVGIHLVVSKHNANEIEKMSALIKQLKPDSFICQIAEKRAELRNLDEDQTPGEEDYLKAINAVKQYKSRRLTSLLRNRYYKKSLKHLETGYSGKCFAGIASAHVNYNGDLWTCCVKAEKMGNLRKASFDSLWNGKEAVGIRKRIKNEKCSCTLANSSYSNAICWPI